LLAIHKEGILHGLKPIPLQTLMFDTIDRYEAFIRDFETCKLPRARWTHPAHLAVGFWYLWHHPPAEALRLAREHIRQHNEGVGTANTDSGGYHETITRGYLHGIVDHRARHPQKPPLESLVLLQSSPMADSAWLLKYYSRDRLFSPQARRSWVDPDLQALPGDAQF
jgi:hypothetical protein